MDKSVAKVKLPIISIANDCDSRGKTRKNMILGHVFNVFSMFSAILIGEVGQ
jgi:hypothetical protein